MNDRHGAGWNALYMDDSVKCVKSEKVAIYDASGGSSQHDIWLILGSTFHQYHTRQQCLPEWRIYICNNSKR